jgi:hypothetical protein
MVQAPEFVPVMEDRSASSKRSLQSRPPHHSTRDPFIHEYLDELDLHRLALCAQIIAM